MSDRTNPQNLQLRQRIRLRFLGVFSLTNTAGVVQRFPTRHAAILVAYLAYNADRVHSRDKLAEMLWPNADFDEQRNRFRVALSQARKLLEPTELDVATVLEVTRQTVKFKRDAATSDIDGLDHALRNLDQAQIALGKDTEFCEGWYDEWVLETRAYWQSRIEAVSGGDVIITEDLRLTTDERAYIPRPHGPFIGREQLLKAISARLTPPDMIGCTILFGPEGSGKTRLALEICRRIEPFWDHKIVRVDITSQTIAEGFGQRLRVMLEGPRSYNDRPVDRILYMPPYRLVWLDGLDRAPDPKGILEACALPGLHIIATSRTPIHGLTAVHIHVPPMPAVNENWGAPELVRADSVALLLSRIQLVDPGFVIRPTAVAAIAKIASVCAKSPLLLQVAAARISYEGPAPVAERLAGFGFDAATVNDVLRALLKGVDLRDVARLSILPALVPQRLAIAILGADATERLTNLVSIGAMASASTPQGLIYRLHTPVADLVGDDLQQYVDEAKERLISAIWDALVVYHGAGFSSLDYEIVAWFFEQAQASFDLPRLHRSALGVAEWMFAYGDITSALKALSIAEETLQNKAVDVAARIHLIRVWWLMRTYQPVQAKEVSLAAHSLYPQISAELRLRLAYADLVVHKQIAARGRSESAARFVDAALAFGDVLLAQWGMEELALIDANTPIRQEERYTRLVRTDPQEATGRIMVRLGVLDTLLGHPRTAARLLAEGKDICSAERDITGVKWAEQWQSYAATLRREGRQLVGIWED